MKKIIKIFVVVVACLLSSQVGVAQEGGSDNKWPNVADTTAAKKAIQADSAVIGSQDLNRVSAVDTVPTYQTEDVESEASEKKETSSALWYIALIWLIVLTAGIAYIFYTVGKRFENHRKTIKKLNEDLLKGFADKTNEVGVLANRLKEMDDITASLRSENERLNRKVISLEGRINGSGNATSVTSAVRSQGHSQSPVPPRGEGNCEEEVYYVDTLNIGGDGTLTIPLQILKEQNSGELFKVVMNTKNNTATYTLNPKASNLMSQVSRLQKFSEGLASLQGNRIVVESPGSLKREGYDLKVVRKLSIKSE